MKALLDKKNSIYVIVFALVIPIIVISSSQCGGKPQSVSKEKYTDIGTDELKTMMEDQTLSLINVHIPYEGEIPGTDMHIPYNEIGEKLDLPKDSMIVLYCKGGPMSKVAAEKLVELGYTNVFDLKSGMVGWQRKGNRLLSQPERRDGRI